MFNSNRKRSAILLIASVIAVAATVCLLPTWGEDVFAEEIGDYEVSDGNGVLGEYTDLSAAFSDINKSVSQDFIITVGSDHAISGPYAVNAGKNITLTSPLGDPYK
ncbi:MAG: hypothetical protein FWF07_00405, partial [Methanomassiliicoccaceae archaeon]|nr:hypothetical protein [Methanomassiliicoccaceae archaeon]